MKTLTVIAKEWFDKANGNSYFSARIFVDNDTENAIILPFQYGYGSQYEWEAHQELVKRGLLPEESEKSVLSVACRDKDINLICTKHENCKKRDVKYYGQD